MADGAGGQGAVVTSLRNVSLCVPGLSIPRAAVCLSVAFLPPHSSLFFLLGKVTTFSLSLK